MMEDRIRSTLADIGYGGQARLFWEDDYVIVELDRQREMASGKNVVFTPACRLPFIAISPIFAEKVLINSVKVDSNAESKVVIEIGQDPQHNRMLMVRELMKFGTLIYLDTSGITSNKPAIAGKIFERFLDKRGYNAALHQKVKINYAGECFMINSFENCGIDKKKVKKPKHGRRSHGRRQGYQQNQQYQSNNPIQYQQNSNSNEMMIDFGQQGYHIPSSSRYQPYLRRNDNTSNGQNNLAPYDYQNYAQSSSDTPTDPRRRITPPTDPRRHIEPLTDPRLSRPPSCYQQTPPPDPELAREDYYG